MVVGVKIRDNRLSDKRDEIITNLRPSKIVIHVFRLDSESSRDTSCDQSESSSRGSTGGCTWQVGKNGQGERAIVDRTIKL